MKSLLPIQTSTYYTSIAVLPDGTPRPSADYFDLALIPVTAAQIEALIGSPLKNGVDAGLGAWSAIGMKFESQNSVELISYSDSPALGFVVRADRDCVPEQVLADTMGLFKLSRNAFSWINPRAHAE